MPNAVEAAKKLAQKQGEFKAFMDTNSDPVPGTTSRNWHFKQAGTQDGIKSFNERNDEMAKLHDEYTQALALDKTAHDTEAAIKAMSAPNPQVPFEGAGGQGNFQGQSDGFPSGMPGLDAYGRPQFQGQAIKSLGAMFLESDAYKANADNKPTSAQSVWKVDIPQASVARNAALGHALSGGGNLKAVFTGGLYGTPGSGTLPFPAQPASIVPFATRRPVLRELLPVDDPGGALVQFIRQNVQTFAADIVAEGAEKPESTLGTERVVLQVETIAHILKVTDQALRFIPGVQNMLDQQGTLGIQLAEEDKILNHNGTSWDGFLVQTGVQSLPLGAVDQFTAFHLGMTQVQYSPGFANVTGGVISPLDWHKVIVTKDAIGRFIYGDPGAADQAARLWGVPLVVTPVITEGTVLIGDFLMYSKWWVPGGIIVKVGYIDNDMRLNQQSIVVEEYGMLEIDRPSAFVKMTGWQVLA